MTGIRLRPGESIEAGLRKLKKQIDRTGIIKKRKAGRFYAKPSVAKREKSKEAAKRRK